MTKKSSKSTYSNCLHAFNCPDLGCYGVATVSRIDKITGLFCRISSLLKGSFAKETYNFIDPTNQSHPIAAAIARCILTVWCGWYQCGCWHMLVARWVTSLIWMSHVTRMNESRHSYEWVMSLVWMSHVTRLNESRHTWMSHITHMHESRCTHEWVTSHTWISHDTRMNESRHTYEWVTSHIWISHVTHMNNSCHTYQWVASPISSFRYGCRYPLVTFWVSNLIFGLVCTNENTVTAHRFKWNSTISNTETLYQ